MKGILIIAEMFYPGCRLDNLQALAGPGQGRGNKRKDHQRVRVRGELQERIMRLLKGYMLTKAVIRLK